MSVSFTNISEIGDVKRIVLQLAALQAHNGNNRGRAHRESDKTVTPVHQFAAPLPLLRRALRGACRLGYCYVLPRPPTTEQGGDERLRSRQRLPRRSEQVLPTDRPFEEALSPRFNKGSRRGQ